MEASHAPAAYPRHCESNAFVPALPATVFAYADDQTQLSSHMSQSSWRMGGGRMLIETDSGRGQRIGSHIRLSGQVFGIAICVEEVIAERVHPQHKVWETIGNPRLPVIGRYRMGFDIAPHEYGSHLRVFIDYALPDALPARWLGYLFADYYARWCTRQMAQDIAEHFMSQAYRTLA